MSSPSTRRASPEAGTTVAQLMTDTVHRVDSAASLHEAAKRMWEDDIGAVPVVDMEGRIAGIVTDRDIAMTCYLKGRRLEDLGVQEAMATDVEVTRPYESPSHARDVMARHQVHRLPVVDDEGLLVGMISLNDLAVAAADEDVPDVTEELVVETLRAIYAPRESEA